jgi:hypothetical protein
VKKLLGFGFTKVGFWKLENGSIQYYLTSNPKTTNVLYSFVHNETIMYIGKTTMSLERRMYGYKNPGQSQRTNIRVEQKIKEYLKNNHSIDIYILIDNGLLKYGDFKINLAGGLEDTLINELNPQWNYIGKVRIEEDNSSQISLKASNMPKTQPKNKNSFEVKIGEAYYNQGFFNVRKEYSNVFGPDKAPIGIQLGASDNNTIYGHINRTANSNNTPRIICGVAFKNWIQSNFSKGDIFNVEILSPVSIRLY